MDLSPEANEHVYDETHMSFTNLNRATSIQQNFPDVLPL